MRYCSYFVIVKRAKYLFAIPTISGGRHFGFETKLDGRKQCNLNNQCILRMAQAFVSAFALENWSKMDLYQYRSVCLYYREERNSGHSPSWQLVMPVEPPFKSKMAAAW